ncbi:dienelactone hydrolase family protein [Scleromatobacter humisilvae]|uniref:Dienelactone hydrolase family protein n=1 Tax=Scleromatobacter humisilvae TaxID=2897159 RepID=A0A9X2C131_9BURK|nr:dienelactone hydrolase family protein [Scleromatobacter humisilvae]MCK9687181.1 dienelactone hydrolase family protein [Scleromatobacter humisilvae]
MASSTVTLVAADGFQSSAYVSEPSGPPKGAIVVLQEIFGVNGHIRSVADRYAAAGYLAIAPSTFDRVSRGVELGYTPDDQKQGAALKAAVEALPAPGVLQDIQAAVGVAARAGKVGIVGYCWGGLLVWRAAEQVHGLSAAVSYYGGGMTAGSEPSRRPAVPTMAHFGELDTHIPVDSVKAFAQAHPDVEVHLYAANHGFNCDQRGAYDAGAAATALERSLYHFGKHVG